MLPYKLSFVGYNSHIILACDRGYCLILFLCKSARPVYLDIHKNWPMGLQFLDSNASLLLAVSDTKLCL